MMESPLLLSQRREVPVPFTPVTDEKDGVQKEQKHLRAAGALRYVDEPTFKAALILDLF